MSCFTTLTHYFILPEDKKHTKNKNTYTKNKHTNCQIGDLDVTMSKKYPPQQLHIDGAGDSLNHHVPVLLNQVLTLLSPQKNETYLDLTAGYGGHATEIIKRTGAIEKATLVDRDDMSMQSLRESSLKDARLIHQDFLYAAKLLAEKGEQFDMILIDLGVSSPQLDKGERGFSFQVEAQLDMRMDRRQSLTAHDIVNKLNLQDLASLIEEYGEERPRSAYRIARAIVSHRPIESTTELASIIKQQYRGAWSRTHPATRTFQALRMKVNDELGQIKETLPLLVQLLNDDGRLVIISFHSLEDRLVKKFFKNEVESGFEARLRLLTKKPISGATEDVNNPRARSAKLRAVAKIKNHERT